jgi:hypothetical protein
MLHRATGKPPAYLYHFARPLPIADLEFPENGGLHMGATHGAEPPYLFGTFAHFPWKRSAGDYMFGDARNG